jgi:hypothetical protein
MTDVITKDLDTSLEDVIEEAFTDFIEEYEMDTTASIEDMLFEFFAEGFMLAIDDAEEEATDEEG